MSKFEQALPNTVRRKLQATRLGLHHQAPSVIRRLIPNPDPDELMDRQEAQRLRAPIWI